MKILDKPCFDNILSIPVSELDHNVAVAVMGEELFIATKENRATLVNNCQPLEDGVWVVVPNWDGKMQEGSKAAVTWIPAYSRSLNLAFLVQKKVYGGTYLEALATFIGCRLGASENTFYHIAEGQLLGRVTGEDICRAALYVSLSDCGGVEVYTGDNSLEHVRELLTYSQQHYQVRPTVSVPEGVAEQCLNLEFEELYEKAQALGKEGYFLDLMMNKIEENNDGEDTNKVDLVALLDACVDQRVVADGTIHKYGFGGIFHAAFMEVHRSNLTKFPTDKDDAEAAVDYYEGRHVEGWGINECFEPCSAEWVQRFANTGNYVIRRTSDGKFLKPPTYSKANLVPILSGAMSTEDFLQQVPVK